MTDQTLSVLRDCKGALMRNHGLSDQQWQILNSRLDDEIVHFELEEPPTPRQHGGKPCTLRDCAPTAEVRR